MRPAFGKDEEGNPKLQHQTYVVLRVTTLYDFDHVIGLIQSSLYDMNNKVKEKDMPSLNTRTRIAIVGTTSEWWPTSLRQALLKDLKKHAKKLHKSGCLDVKHHNKPVPPFLLHKTR
jgi:hypothetical protein